MKLKIPEYAAAVISALEEAGHEAYAVGGCVRDTMLGKEPNDWDVTTSARPDEVRRLFTFLYGFTAIPTGIEHGTVTVLSENKPVEVTTFRIDGEYTDCRRPDSVEFCDKLSLDLARRDFTVNAMAYSDERGLIDLYGGADDLEKGIIRCVGEPEKRFGEDALRILRALRFASVLGFDIDGATSAAVLKLRGSLSHVSRERIGAELAKLVCGRNAAKIVGGYLPVIEAVLDSFTGDGIETVLLSMDRLCGSELPLMLAALLAQIDPEKVKEAVWSVRIDKKTASRVQVICQNRSIPLCDKSDVKRLCRDIGTDVARDVIKLGMARGERDGSALEWLDAVVRNGECVSLKQLAVSGEDIIALGIESKDIGRYLNKALDLVISDEAINEREAIISAIKSTENK